MKMIKNIILDKKANSVPLTIAVTLALIIVTLVVSEFFRMLIITSGVRDAMQSAVISVSVTNWNEVYDGIREGYSGSYSYNEDSESWEELIDYGDIYLQLDNILGTEYENGKHTKFLDNGYDFSISNLKIDIKNIEIAPRKANENFHAEVSIDIEIPFLYFGDVVSPVKLTLNTEAEYLNKF